MNINLEELLDQEHLAIAKKLGSVEEIPTWNELKKLYDKLLDVSKIEGDQTQIAINTHWLILCKIHNIYHAFCYEFVQKLAEEIQKLEIKGNIIEICAGNGKLSYWLKHFGIPSIATDDYSLDKIKNRDPKYAERLSHMEAIAKYNPELVIASWIPQDSRIAMDVLDSPKVKYYIDIGTCPEAFTPETTGVVDLWERMDVSYTPLDSTDAFALSTLDFITRWTQLPQSRATLFEKD